MIFGFFDDPTQDVPAHDPGLDTPCPICGDQLTTPMRTISLMREGDHRSYFYRIHKVCDDADAKCVIESLLIDGISAPN